MRLTTGRRWASAGPVTTGLAMALLPKCPACAAAYLGVFSAFGLDRWAPTFMWPLTYALFTLSLAFLGYRAWREGAYRPFAVALLGAAVLVAARLEELSAPVLWLGLGLFVLGVVWSSQAGLSPDTAPCHSVEGVAS